MKKIFCLLIGCAVLLAAPARAQSADTVSGEKYRLLVESQETDFQQALRLLLPESEGYFVSGPLDPSFVGDADIRLLYHCTRVVVPGLATLDTALAQLKAESTFDVKKVNRHVARARSENPAGYRGIIAQFNWHGSSRTVELITLNQLRWLIWARPYFTDVLLGIDEKALGKYMMAVSDYLYGVDLGRLDSPAPLAISANLPDTVDLFPPVPPMVITSDSAFENLLEQNAAIYTDFARGELEFVPDDSLQRAMISAEPHEAFSDRDYFAFQGEMHRFLSRGGTLSAMQTLTRAGLDTLAAGKYFFGVGGNGTIRIFPDKPLTITSDEPEYRRTGHVDPPWLWCRQSFLYPGEPLLTAGMMTIERDTTARICAVNTRTDAYFYSRFSPTIVEDISERSNYYLLTLGHFIKALDSLGIPHSSPVISKF